MWPVRSRSLLRRFSKNSRRHSANAARLVADSDSECCEGKVVVLTCRLVATFYSVGPLARPRFVSLLIPDGKLGNNFIQLLEKAHGPLKSVEFVGCHGVRIEMHNVVPNLANLL